MVNPGRLLTKQGWQKFSKNNFCIQISITSLSFELLTWNKRETVANLKVILLGLVSVFKSLKFLSYWPESWGGVLYGFEVVYGL